MRILPILVCFSFLLLLPQSPVEAQRNEVAALLSIKNAVGASNPYTASWNDSATNPCNWTGVTCSASNRVISLNMSRFNLRGQLPSDSFSSFTALTSLDLSNNYLMSPLPSLSALTQLNDLNISSNTFNEPFPDILSLKQLSVLQISNNRFQGAVPEQISNLQNLQQLWLGNNSLTSLPKSLTSLPLTVLTAWGNPDLKLILRPEWGVWVNLTYLNLHDTGLHGTLPQEWGVNFTNLQRLHLYQNDLTGSIPESWKTMTSLTELRMYTNELSGIVPSWIGDLEKRGAARVEFKCNFLQGPYPAFYNDTVWKGNCFDTDFGAHRQVCGDDKSCEEFFATSKGKKGFPMAAIIGTVSGVVVLLCGIIFLIWWFKPCSTKKNPRHRNDQETGDWEVPPGVRRFTYKEIMKATKSFSKGSEIGAGGFGKVYVGLLDDNRQVAIKRASEVSLQGSKEFRNEIMLLSRLHHRHLVRLEGFCDDKFEQILVYEYMKNGNLHRHLFDKDASTLNWYRRLEIALAVAQGLEYLHTFADPPVIHRDVKPSNILLDGNMIAKVSDFGISKANSELDTHVSTRPAGTAGYLDPEYFLRRQLTTASDVYGYGVVLLELLTGQVAIDHRRTEDYNIVGWVNAKLKWNGDLRSIIDPRLGLDYPIEEYKQVVELAIQCTKYERNDRPKMQAVAAMLEEILARVQAPPEHTMDLPSPLRSQDLEFRAANTDNSLTDIQVTNDPRLQPR